MHVKHLMIDNETMSKSKGNFFTIPDLVERGHGPEAIRYLLAGSHYRAPLSFGFESLQQAAVTLERIRGLVQRLEEVDREGSEGPAGEACAAAETRFREALADDLNTPEALAALHGLVGRANGLLAEGAVTRAGATTVRATLGRMDSVLGMILPATGEEQLSPAEQAVFEERQEARRQRDFRRADELRGRLEAMGIVLEDTKERTRWRRTRRATE
jgi:cysteinyl-tRNA synthetase